MTAVTRQEEKRLMGEYKASPKIAWPTTILCFVMVAVIVATWVAALNGTISLWLGALINGMASYGMFSVIHDSSHRAISSNRFFNDFIGTIGLLFLFPYAPMPILRWLHMQHHMYTNADIDPDWFTHTSPKWQAPVRWAIFDGYYMYYYFRNGGQFVRKFMPTFLLYVGIVVPVLGAAIYYGYALEVFMLWFIPTRIGLFLIDVVFVILPHHPGIVSQQEDPFLATTMRMGWEWLLTPLMVYQNYHLIHHLYPTVPFYKMHKVWDLRKEQLTRHDVSYQTAFGLEPDNMDVHRSFHANQAAQPAQA
ncbi:MAG TPA: fatty acid desaturase [Gammaproteobacteria bacterium]|nr:fatty acid desaturase [Gammaproteobacteria bacterium]